MLTLHKKEYHSPGEVTHPQLRALFLFQPKAFAKTDTV